MLKQSLALSIALTLSALAAPAMAQDVTYKLGVGTVKEVYDEFDADGSQFMTEKATLKEISGQVSLDTGAGIHYRLKGNYAWGSSDYIGAYQGGNYGDLRINGQDRSRYTVAGLALMDVPTYDNFSMKVGAGLGYRHLEDKLSQAGPGGYDRTNELKMAIVTAEAVVPVQGLAIKPEVSYYHVIKGTQKSKMSDMTIVHDQKNGHGYEIAVGIATKVSGVALEVTPYLTKYSIGRSSETLYHSSVTVEPKNKTKETGVRLSVLF